MIYFLLKFNLPTNSYFFATDIATIESERKFIKATFVSNEICERCKCST